jgi:hypothetical protein
MQSHRTTATHLPRAATTASNYRNFAKALERNYGAKYDLRRTIKFMMAFALPPIGCSTRGNGAKSRHERHGSSRRLGYMWDMGMSFLPFWRTPEKTSCMHHACAAACHRRLVDYHACLFRKQLMQTARPGRKAEVAEKNQTTPYFVV